MNRTKGFLLGLAAGAGAVALARARTADDLTDMVALVTGGSRGLGFLLARELLREGCYVAVCARDPLELAAARVRLAAEGRTRAHVIAVRCDVGDESDVVDMIRHIGGELGALDIVVNNAGVMQVGPEAAMTRADYEEALDVMLWGAVNVTRAVLPVMRARGSGRIANVTSIGGKLPLPHMVPYSAAKHALVGFSESLAADVAQDGIHVTTVVPGFMRTGSPVNAWFKGDASAEYRWFGAGSATPLTSTSAERAARRIVLAIRRREREIVLTWQAKSLRMAHALAPRLMIAGVSLVNRVLPHDTRQERWRGMEVDRGYRHHPLYAPIYRAARRNNEYAGVYSEARLGDS